MASMWAQLMVCVSLWCVHLRKRLWSYITVVHNFNVAWYDVEMSQWVQVSCSALFEAYDFNVIWSFFLMYATMVLAQFVQLHGELLYSLFNNVHDVFSIGSRDNYVLCAFGMSMSWTSWRIVEVSISLVLSDFIGLALGYWCGTAVFTYVAYPGDLIERTVKHILDRVVLNVWIQVQAFQHLYHWKLWSPMNGSGSYEQAAPYVDCVVHYKPLWPVCPVCTSQCILWCSGTWIVICLSICLSICQCLEWLEH